MDIREKIKALMSKTADNGASEAEAMQALEMASRLMAKHGVTMDDLRATKEEDFVTRGGNTAGQLHAVDKLLQTTIAKVTGTKTWISNSSGLHRGRTPMFFGYAADVDYALYMREVIKTAMEAEWAKSKSKFVGEVHGRAARSSFMAGMAKRIRERLNEMFADRVKETPKGNELVVLKGQMVESAYANLGMKLKKTYTKSTVGYSGYAEGYAAGNKVQFNKSLKVGALAIGKA